VGIKQHIGELRAGQRITHGMEAKLKGRGVEQDKITEAFDNYRKYAASKQEQIRTRSLRAGGFVLAITEPDSQETVLTEVSYCEYDPWEGGQLIGMPGAVPFELDEIVDIRGWDADHIAHPELPLDKDEAFYTEFYNS
jgi:hypothetical protein